MTNATFSCLAGTSEDGVQTEIYLPRKWYFQRFIYDVLINGLNIECVRKSLIDNIQDVKELMKDFAVPLVSTPLRQS